MDTLPFFMGFCVGGFIGAAVVMLIMSIANASSKADSRMRDE